MYRRKLFAVATIFATLAVAGSVLLVGALRLTQQQLTQAQLARELLSEHLELGILSYRYFKQLTDGILIGAKADQSRVRNKRENIARNLARIRDLEVEQRVALGPGMTAGSIEDTDELERLIDQIAGQLQQLAGSAESTSRRDRMASTFEDSIDVAFREAINTAIQRQRRVIDTMEQGIQQAQWSMLIAAGVFLVLSLALVIGGTAILTRGIAGPLQHLHRATSALRRGELTRRVGGHFDQEFESIANAFDDMAEAMLAQQRERDKAQDSLEREVDRRTRDLSSLNKRLVEVDTARRDFLAEISHELRTPLSVVLGEAKLALRRYREGQTVDEETIRAIHQEAAQLSRLVDDMLFIARTESRVLRLEMEPVDLIRLAHDVSASIMRTRQPFRVSVEPPSDRDVLIVLADYGRIQQMLGILLDNAVRHAGADSEATVALSESAGEIHIQVRDNGPGFVSSELALIFERFYRGRRQNGGIGLGLALARAIVHAHDGRISASNHSGGGGCIDIWLSAK